MKSFIKNSIVKKIVIVLVTFIMLFNFIMPNYVYAENSVGAKMINGIVYSFAWIGDAALSLMQYVMMGVWSLQENGVYQIKYSPGIIFSNTVPALDINFVSASEKDNDTVDRFYTDVDSKSDMVKLIDKSTIKFADFEKVDEGEIHSKDDIYQKNGITLNLHTSSSEGDVSSGIDVYSEQYLSFFQNWGMWGNLKKIEKIVPSEGFGLTDTLIIYLYGENLYMIHIDGSNYTVYSIPTDKLSQDKEQIELKSTALTLQKTIASWYVVLRRFALVGLLSALLYIGIRIILSSGSAQDKAKYKNMLKDWLVAVCILFVLHYIMAFMLGITDNINEVFKSTGITITEAGNNSDELMNEIRTNVGDINENTTLEMAGYTIIYLALVIFTGVFTVQYLKRVIFVAFLTIIAPMIALTYPIDKVKDGKAQAFSYWLREYIFNCLIQPVHLMLYTVLITTSLELAKENPIFAVVAIAFLTSAEKFIKDMFGMKSSSPTGTLGAAAGGALVMNMLNKAKNIKGPKGGEGRRSKN